ncbi:MAG: GNAT family N-acetyltransferase [Provencibacterium sp.]|nr:GNAT family N-acetyltransferase [Provencibacterium sp.]
MHIAEARERPSSLIDRLLEIWEGSVKAAHLFLSEQGIEAIKPYVPQALRTVPHLVVAENAHGCPAAFMGAAGRKLEMLFVSTEERGKGLGKRLLEYGIEAYSIRELAVNEQNPLARGFYERMGFQVYQRTGQDEQGNPYPLLYMRRDG